MTATKSTRKGRYLTKSPKATPFINRTANKNKAVTQRRQQTVRICNDYGQLRTVSLSDYRHPTGVGNQLTGSTFSLPATVAQSKGCPLHDDCRVTFDGHLKKYSNRSGVANLVYCKSRPIVRHKMDIHFKKSNKPHHIDKGSLTIPRGKVKRSIYWHHAF